MDSISLPQLHSGFVLSLKLYLNLCSLQWVKPRLNLIIKQIPVGLQQLERKFGDGPMKLWILASKTETQFHYLIIYNIHNSVFYLFYGSYIF